MHLRLLRRPSLFAVLLIAATAVLAAPKVETTGPCTERAVPDAVRQVLAAQGYRVTLDDGGTANLWPAAQTKCPRRLTSAGFFVGWGGRQATPESA